MIISFKDKDTEKIYHQLFTKRFSLSIQRLAWSYTYEKLYSYSNN